MQPSNQHSMLSSQITTHQVSHTTNNSTNNPDNLAGDAKVLDFLDTLVGAMLGVKIADIPTEKQTKVVSECVQVFADYMLEYTTINFGPTQALRLKAIQQFPDQNIFEKFPEMEGVFRQATLSFLNSLK